MLNIVQLLFVKFYSPKEKSATSHLNGTLRNHRSSGGKYFPEEECGWSIILPVRAAHHLIRLKFTELETEEKCDFVEIYDGYTANYPLITRVSGNVTPEDYFYTTGNVVFIRFTTNDVSEFSGFTIEWSTVSTSSKASVTHQITDQKSGVIANPQNVNSHYFGGDRYKWNITLPDALTGCIIKFQFIEFDVCYDTSSSTRCRVGFVKIFDGTTANHPKIVEWSGYSVPLYYFYTTGQHALVEFYAEKEWNSGFTLIWNAVSVTEA